jgi:hypothetical protein
MRIGFFGDSFCADNVAGSYLQLVAQHYNATVVNVGMPGGNNFDTILLQYKPFETDPPDISVFCWTSHTRLFHRTVRGMKSNSFDRLFRITNRKIYNAGKKYYQYLYDEEKSRIETIGALMYFDTVLSTNKNKIVHLWCFEKYCTFTHGQELDLILNKFNTADAPNHIAGDNNILANMLISIIDKQ